MKRHSALLPCVLLCFACSSGGGQQSLTPTSEAVDVRSEILRWEAARSDGGGRLLELAQAQDPLVRARAVQALGRLPLSRHGAPVSERLVACLADPDPDVRRRAAFALGQRGDNSTAAAITRRLRGQENDPTVRTALIEGGSRFADATVREEILFNLSHPEVAVRAAAAVAPHRWTEEPSIGPDAAQIESVLVQITTKRPLLAGRPTEVPGFDYFEAEEEDAEVIWKALFTLQRRSSLRAREAFHLHSRARLPLESRLFAIKGLANLARLERGQDEGSRKVLEGALSDSDWRVVCEALTGLERYAASDSLVALSSLLEHRSAHVRRSLWSALGALPATVSDQLEEPLETALGDRSVGVRAAAVVAGTRLGLLAEERLRELAQDEEVWVRAAVAEAAPHLADGAASGGILLESVGDEHPAVSGRGASALGELLFREDRRGLDPEAWETLREILVELTQANDLGLRLAGVQALRGHARDSDLAALERAYRSAEGDLGPEVRFNVLRTVAEIEGAEVETLALLVDGQSDPHPYVSDVARGLVNERDPSQVAEAIPYRGTLVPSETQRYASAPLVEVHTTRGMMLFELFPEEAPLHVENFLSLAAKGFYEDLSFHRVVPDFVIQGGCYRGDGNGSLTSERGRSLPAEIGSRSYVRGSLGMPRNEDLDSGGSQIFVTHRRTPHLDGRYTIFGELRSGFEVLDAIELGDRILSVRRRVDP